MTLVTICLLAWAALAAIMAGAWALQRALHNAGWVDAVWTLGLGATGIAVALSVSHWAAGPSGPQVALLIGLWSLRLGGHIAARSRGAPEDARYAALRESWGTGYEVRMLGFLQIQAAAAALLIVPIALAASAPWPPAPIALLGLAIALAGLATEAVADAQLRAFRRKAGHGQVCDTGLWSLSRHPNYLGEFLFWLGLALFALPAPFGPAALIGPAFIYWLLVHVSGIPPLEAAMLKSRGEAYAAYQRRVPPFFPRPFARRPVQPQAAGE